MADNGYSLEVKDVANMSPIKQQYQVPLELQSCHTAIIDGYVIEGHVPAREIRRLLMERPAAIGLSVPGMPLGSPGMDGPEYGGRKDDYAVLLLSKDGRSSVYHAYS